jgi:hypothetical protein
MPYPELDRDITAHPEVYPCPPISHIEGVHLPFIPPLPAQINLTQHCTILPMTRVSPGPTLLPLGTRGVQRLTGLAFLRSLSGCTATILLGICLKSGTRIIVSSLLQLGYLEKRLRKSIMCTFYALRTRRRHWKCWMVSFSNLSEFSPLYCGFSFTITQTGNYY